MMFLLVACSNDGNDNDVGEATIDGIDRIIIETYIYKSDKVDFGDLPYNIYGITAYGEQIVFLYVNSTPSIVIAIIEANGSPVHETHIPIEDGKYVNGTVGLQITDEGNIEIVKAMSDGIGPVEVSRNIYNKQGSLLSSQNLSGIARQQNFFPIFNAVFTENGNLAFVALDGGFDNAVLYMIASDGEALGELQVTLNQSIIKLKDGRVAALSNDGNIDYLHVIDFNTGSWGEIIPLPTSNAVRVITASASTPYDILIDDGWELIGYTFDTAIQTPLLSWLGTGVSVGPNHHIGILSDGRIFTLFVDLVSPGFAQSDWYSEIFTFTRNERSDEVHERTVLTLGGLSIPDNIRAEVARFNHENQNYQIQINDFGYSDDWEHAVTRFNVEMIAGRGPDILMVASRDNYDFLADLYTFIDADPDLSRASFFPNVLSVKETAEGALPWISNSFDIRTVLTTRENAALFQPFTFNNLLRQLDEVDSPESLGGFWMTRFSFMFTALQMSGDSFIDYTNNRANFDSEEFINVLEVAAGLPDPGNAGIDDEVARLHGGEQLLLYNSISNLEWFHEVQTVFGDGLVAIGMPTPEGGQHGIAMTGGGIGINAASPHQEAAWSFIRRLLLPDADVGIRLPLNVDAFEARITGFMTPNIWDETIPEIGAIEGEERPHESHHLNPRIYIYAMTEHEASVIRDIINSASIVFEGNMTVWFIVQEGLDDIVNGVRSASDAARIIQNRVQTYLYEQG
jgi:hypothetical protein